jgi:integrase
LADPTYSKYVTLLERLKKFADGHGFTRLDEINTFEQLTAFKRTWPTKKLATIKTISRLRAFLAFCVAMKWIKENAAKQLKMPPGGVIERVPFTLDDEIPRIFEAARTVDLDPQQPATNEELEVFVRLMRETGLAISDAALLQTSEIRGDETHLYRKKMRRNENRILVVLPIPLNLLARLEKLPLKHGKYYFAHGTPNIKCQVESWGKRLKEVFKAAGVNGKSHQFRHTFATDLLDRGASVSDVARWLGHGNTRTVEKHYSHWIKSRVERASARLRELNASRDALASF